MREQGSRHRLTAIATRLNRLFSLLAAPAGAGCAPRSGEARDRWRKRVRSGGNRRARLIPAAGRGAPSPARPAAGGAAVILTLLLAGPSGPAGASPAMVAGAAPDVSAVCDRAASQAAQETGVPLSVLRAISLTETGRRQGGQLRPWPWTVNMEGKGSWFASLPEAYAYVQKEMARGATSFDLGCFQINYRWHGENFGSVREMFDPLANARYAAQFIANLKAELGDWSRAAGAFHSRTPEYANRYRARFDQIRADLGGSSDIPEIPDIVLAENRRQGRAGGFFGDLREAAARENLYPLLRGGGGGSGGSLFPAGASGTRSALFAAAARPLIGGGTE